MNPTKRAELLKDRQDYRQALIHKRERLEEKLNHVEQQIAGLKKA
jgi:hypothetical protein